MAQPTRGDTLSTSNLQPHPPSPFPPAAISFSPSLLPDEPPSPSRLPAESGLRSLLCPTSVPLVLLPRFAAVGRPRFRSCRSLRSFLHPIIIQFSSFSLSRRTRPIASFNSSSPKPPGRLFSSDANRNCILSGPDDVRFPRAPTRLLHTSADRLPLSFSAPPRHRSGALDDRNKPQSAPEYGVRHRGGEGRGINCIVPSKGRFRLRRAGRHPLFFAPRFCPISPLLAALQRSVGLRLASSGSDPKPTPRRCRTHRVGGSAVARLRFCRDIEILRCA